MACGLNVGFKSIPYITLPGTFILLSTTAKRTPFLDLPIVSLSLSPSLSLTLSLSKLVLMRATLYNKRTISCTALSDLVLRPRDRFSIDPHP